MRRARRRGGVADAPRERLQRVRVPVRESRVQGRQYRPDCTRATHSGTDRLLHVSRHLHCRQGAVLHRMLAALPVMRCRGHQVYQ